MSSKKPEVPNEPVLVSEDNVLGKQYQHPSYGVVQLSRVSGLKTLFGSNLRHQHFVALRIGGASRYVGDSGEERIHGSSMRGELVEVCMSEAQFGQLLSSMNMGTGVPCTLTYVNKQQIADCPVDHVKERFQETIKEDARKLSAQLSKIKSEIAARFADPRALTKVEKQDLLKKLDLALMEMTENIPFVQEMMQEKLEEQVIAAKTEIDSHLQMRAQQIGMQNIQERVAVLGEGFDDRPALPSGKEEQ